MSDESKRSASQGDEKIAALMGLLGTVSNLVQHIRDELKRHLGGLGNTEGAVGGPGPEEATEAEYAARGAAGIPHGAAEQVRRDAGGGTGSERKAAREQVMKEGEKGLEPAARGGEHEQPAGEPARGAADNKGRRGVRPREE